MKEKTIFIRLISR